MAQIIDGNLEPLAEVQGALLVVEVLHAPHPKLLGLLLVGGEHLTAHTYKEGSQHTFPRRVRTQDHSANPFDLFPNQAKAVGKQQGATDSAVVTKKNSGGHAQLTPAGRSTSCFRHTPV